MAPSKKIGSASTMSGRWVPPPSYASLPTNTSPGCMAAVGWRLRMCGMMPMKEPRCIGMCSAWHSVSPRALNSAVEQSRRSLMLVE